MVLGFLWFPSTFTYVAVMIEIKRIKFWKELLGLNSIYNWIHFKLKPNETLGIALLIFINTKIIYEKTMWEYSAIRSLYHFTFFLNFTFQLNSY